jgi:hypothetical protein
VDRESCSKAKYAAEARKTIDRAVKGLWGTFVNDLTNEIRIRKVKAT